MEDTDEVVGEKDTQPVTQNENDLINPSPDDSVLWGLLMWNDQPERDPEKLSIEKNCYIVGRNNSCDIILSLKHCDRSFLSNISREHFSIKRISDPVNGNHILLEDHSGNGTFVNANKVGKGNRKLLSNGDEIGLTHKKGTTFIFFDTHSKQLGYPLEITKKYLIVKLIGKGSYGEVHLAFLKQSSKKYAIKSVLCQKKNDNRDPVDRLLNEAKVLCALEHPCVVKIHDVIYGVESIHLILELMEGGDLLELLRYKKILPEWTAKFYFLQICLAVEYFHSQGIVHRDIKPENILLSNHSEDAIIKVTDFGLSKLVNDTTCMKTYCGTPCYLAPEVIKAKSCKTQYTNSCDIWSMGVVLFYLLSGYHPFMDRSSRLTIEEQILNGRVVYHTQRWDSVTPHGLDFVKNMMKMNPQIRPTISELLADSWLDDPTVVEKVQRVVFQSSTIKIKEEPLCKRIRLES